MSRLDGVLPFLGPEQQQKILELVDRGRRTAKDLFNQSIVIYREPPGGGPPTDETTIDIIMLRFGQRGADEDNNYGPITLTSTTGILQIEEGVFDLRIDDVFTFQDRSCRVIAVYPPEFGAITAEVELTQ